MKTVPRKQLFVDPAVQGTLLARVAIYWLACLATVTAMVLCWRILTGPARVFFTHFDDMWFHFGPALVAALLLLPLALVDVARVSNRFAGPLYRMRAGLRRLAHGQRVDPLTFREGDFWHPVAEEFNAVVRRISELESWLAEAEARNEEPPKPVAMQHAGSGN